MLDGQPNHDWQLCIPLKLHAGGLDFRLFFAWFGFLVSRDGPVALFPGAIGLSAVCDIS